MSKAIDWLKENWVNVLVMISAWLFPAITMVDVVLDYGRIRPAYSIDLDFIRIGIIVMMPWGYGMQCILKKLFGLAGVE